MYIYPVGKELIYGFSPYLQVLICFRRSVHRPEGTPCMFKWIDDQSLVGFIYLTIYT